MSPINRRFSELILSLNWKVNIFNNRDSLKKAVSYQLSVIFDIIFNNNKFDYVKLLSK